MGASVAPTDRTGESRQSITDASKGFLMGDHRRHMSVGDAAAALDLSKRYIRQIFDASGGAAGERDPDTGERLIDRAWVEARRETRRQRPTRSVPDSLSVDEAATRLQVSKNTVRRWFDRDQPASGERIEGGRTGSSERRCSTAWVERLAGELDAARDTPG